MALIEDNFSPRVVGAHTQFPRKFDGRGWCAACALVEQGGPGFGVCAVTAKATCPLSLAAGGLLILPAHTLRCFFDLVLGDCFLFDGVVVDARSFGCSLA